MPKIATAMTIPKVIADTKFPIQNNKDIINVTGYNLTSGAYYLPVSDFTCNDADAADGEALIYAIPVTILDASLLIGISSIEDIYSYYESMSIPVPEALYSSSSPWIVMVYGALNANP